MNKIKLKIEELHTDSKGLKDDKQLEVIFSKDKRIIVEAPAGYGKTRTMISKIAYLIASDNVPNPKKILTLTFSVNAAYKIKRDISEQLPVIFEDSYHSPTNLKKKIFATNYHGFCRRILQLYGYLISPYLKNIDNLKGIDDSKYNLKRLNLGLGNEDVKEISLFSEKVKKIDVEYLKTNFNSYLEKVKDLILPKGYITFNAILLFTLKLFEKFPAVLKLYRSCFPIIIIDEYQDTNILSYRILQKLIENDTQLIIMGDPLQRIYGFIGAIPKIMSISQKRYGMKKIVLETNHRFSNNPNMLKLDKNIRENAKNIRKPYITDPADIKLIEANNQKEEAERILNLILKDDSTDKFVILVRGRSKNTDKILDTFNGSINYFNALFNDDDEEYINFHQKALNEFINILKKNNGRFNKAISNRLLKKLKIHYANEDLPVFNSLLKLLDSFLALIFEEYNFLSSNEKIEFIKDTLENRALKQYLEHIDSKVIITTVHGAKGLEWEYVIIVDMENGSFPSWMSLCKLCKFKRICNIDWGSVSNGFEKSFYEELSVFYVASTRAKKEVYFSYSQFGLNKWGNTVKNRASCFLNLEGINKIY